MTPSLALQICLVFGLASLESVGGGNAIVPELHLQTVTTYGWMSAQQFTDSFAIAQVAPGPSSLLVTLLGFQIAGAGGALLATMAMLLPASLLVAYVSKVWTRHSRSRWQRTLEVALAPIAIGLVTSSGLVVARSVDASATQWAISAGAALTLVVWRINPVAVLLCGGLLASGLT